MAIQSYNGDTFSFIVSFTENIDIYLEDKLKNITPNLEKTKDFIVCLKRTTIREQKGVNITVKMAKGYAKEFAPTWNMVMEHKGKTLSTVEYIDKYFQILDEALPESWDWLWEQGKSNKELFLVCFCPDEVFCHTYLLSAYACIKYPKMFSTIYFQKEK
jgi:uncharacterized protein YeaO (DUF488 family)